MKKYLPFLLTLVGAILFGLRYFLTSRLALHAAIFGGLYLVMRYVLRILIVLVLFR